MKILYKDNVYDVSNEVTKQQFLNNGGEIYLEKVDLEDNKEVITPKKQRGRKKRME